MPLVRIFGDFGMLSAFTFVLKADGNTGIKLEFLEPHQFIGMRENDIVADMHVYVGTPARLALGASAALRHVAIRVPDTDAAWLDEYDRIESLPSVVRGRVDLARRLLAFMRKPVDTAAAAAATASDAVPHLSVNPKIAVVTLTTLERIAVWSENMTENIKRQRQRQPVSWYIVCDAGSAGVIESVIDNVHVVETADDASIGAKRNAGCEAARRDGCEVIMMMDDDDFYPIESVAKRLAALRKTGKPIVMCSTIPMYDPRQYSSAMNVPPLLDEPHLRGSEASLAFLTKAWEAQKFAEDVKVAEGAGFLVGRMQQVAEISPLSIIVAIQHGGNCSSRKFPTMKEPNGCHWQLPGSYLNWLQETIQKLSPK